MLAGAVAGTLEHTLMFPVDTVKTRMQALAHPGQRVRLHTRSCLADRKGPKFAQSSLSCARALTEPCAQPTD